MTPRRVLRAAILVVAILALAEIGFRLTPATWWVDPARFVRPRDSFVVVDRDGALLRHARAGGADRRWVALRDVSPDFVHAVVAAEDARFYDHDGVDALALGRAALGDLLPWGPKSGASTITQQLVKRVYGRPWGIFSKPVEIVRARALERLLTKDEILEQYVNRVPFGDGIEGVERASEEYFGKDARSLDAGQAALLAGLPRAPSATNPRRHPARARRRRDYVLSRLAAVGAIDEDARRRLAAEVPSVLPARRGEAAPFVDAAIARWEAGEIDRGGGRLRTSLDLRLQREAEQTLAATVARFESRGVTNGAAVVVDNASGEILAYVGAAREGVRAPGGAMDLVARPRQPGSALKPFVYELFFERGGTAATMLDDVAVPRTGARGADFDPKDYDGHERGPVRARVALASSLNLAALDVAGRVGEHAIVERLRALGFHDVGDADRYGAAAVLGGVDVTPFDLAGAYATLARGGTRVPLAFAEVGPREGERVMGADAAEIAKDILSDPRVRADAFGGDLRELTGGATFALKTGTSSGWRDAWAVVFDDRATVVVWLGDPAGRPLGAVTGFEAAAPAAARILAAADPAPEPRERPPLVTVAVCAATGLLAGPHCPHSTTERFAPGTVPRETCNLHDEHGDLVLPARYADWIRRAHPPGVAAASPGSEGDAPLVVLAPRDGARLLADAFAVVPLRARGARDLAWEVDGRRVDGAIWRPTPGDHAIVAVHGTRRSAPARVHVDSQ